MVERREDSVPNLDCHDEGLAFAFESFAERLLVDPLADIEQLLGEHGEHAEQLRSMLPAMKILADAGGRDSTTWRASRQEESLEMKSSRDKETRTLGDYEILGEIGRGGMGVVYAARQISLGRSVALKVLPMAALLDQRQLTRFHNEARTAATLNHPHIVPVYAVGEQRGVHYYAMQYIHGHSMAEVIQAMRKQAPMNPAEGNALPVDEKSAPEVLDLDDALSFFESVEPSDSGVPRSEVTKQVAALSTLRSGKARRNYRELARLGVQVARALDYAHANGVLHRDIKPANIMIDMDGQAWIADFGLARIEGDAGMTMTGDLVGTLKYMSPEQALAKRVVVDHRSDVYSLGVTLYELFTLKSAVNGRDRKELLQRIAFEDPTSPRKLDADLPFDLETIVMKASAKRPEDRYVSAAEFADDLERFANQQPIHAKPPTMLDRMVKWSSRHQAATWATACVLTVIAAVSMVGIIWVASVNRQLLDATNQATESAAETSRALADEKTATELALSAKREAQHNFYLATMRQAHADWKNGQTMRLYESLMQFVPRKGEEDLRHWEWYYLLGLCRQGADVLRGHSWGINGVVWSPDGTRIASCCADQTVRIWDVQTKQTTAILGHPDNVRDLHWHPDGKQLVTSSFRKRDTLLWDLESGKIVRRFPMEGKAAHVEISPDGKHLAAAIHSVDDVGFKVWNMESGEVVWAWAGDERGDCIEIDWSPDSRLLACATANDGSSVVVWDVRANQEVLSFRVYGDLADVDWSSDQKRLAVGGFSGDLRVFDAQNGELLQGFQVGSAIQNVCFSPDDRLLAANGDQSISIWDLENEKLAGSLRGHLGSLLDANWHPNRLMLATTGFDATIRIWDLTSLDNVMSFENAAERRRYPKLRRSPDDRMLAEIDEQDQCVRVFETSEFDQLFRIDLRVKDNCDVEWSAGGKILAISDLDQRVTLLDASTWKTIRVLTTELKGMPQNIAWHPNEPLLAATIWPDEGNVGQVVAWNVETGEQTHEFNPNQDRLGGLAWSPDGTKVATAGPGTIRIWDAIENKLLHTLVGQTTDTWIAHLEWSPDGSRLATAGWDRAPFIWDAESGELLHKLYGHTSWLEGIGWSGDGKRLVSKSADQTVRLWDPETGSEILEFENAGGIGIEFKARDQLVNGQRHQQIWDAKPGRDYAATPLLLEDQAHLLISRRDIDEAYDVWKRIPPESPLHQRVSYRLFQRYTRRVSQTFVFHKPLGNSVDRALETWRGLRHSPGPELANVYGDSPIHAAALKLGHLIDRTRNYFSWNGYESQDHIVRLVEATQELEDYLRDATLPTEQRSILHEQVAKMWMRLSFGPPTEQYVEQSRDRFLRGVRMLRELRRQKPDDLGIMTWLVSGQTRSVHWRSCDLQHAFECAEELMERDSNPNHWQLYGWACLRVGKLDEAHDWFAKFNDRTTWPEKLDKEVRRVSELHEVIGLFGAALVEHARENHGVDRKLYEKAVDTLHSHTKRFDFHQRLSYCAPIFREAAEKFDDVERFEEISYRSYGD